MTASPKRIVNAYELGHTEYKLTLRMVVGLPAVESLERSHVEAISYAGGGQIADSFHEWRIAHEQRTFPRLLDPFSSTLAPLLG